MNVNITETEYQAICLAIEEIEANIEGDVFDESVDKYNPALRELNNITAKYKRAKARADRRESVLEVVMAMYPHEKPVFWSKVVNLRMRKEKV